MVRSQLDYELFGCNGELTLKDRNVPEIIKKPIRMIIGEDAADFCKRWSAGLAILNNEPTLLNTIVAQVKVNKLFEEESKAAGNSNETPVLGLGV